MSFGETKRYVCCSVLFACMGYSSAAVQLPLHREASCLQRVRLITRLALSLKEESGVSVRNQYLVGLILDKCGSGVSQAEVNFGDILKGVALARWGVTKSEQLEDLSRQDEYESVVRSGRDVEAVSSALRPYVEQAILLLFAYERSCEAPMVRKIYLAGPLTGPIRSSVVIG